MLTGFPFLVLEFQSRIDGRENAFFLIPVLSPPFFCALITALYREKPQRISLLVLLRFFVALCFLLYTLCFFGAMDC
jgi:dolichol kinase